VKTLSEILNEIECRKGVAARFAATQMDWQQVVLNGGPPCFYLCNDQHFCGRAEKWGGHGEPGFHDFVSLADLIHAARTDIPALVKALREQEKALAHMVSLNSRILRESHRERTNSEIAAILNGEKTDLGEKETK
jgi:hypothetical protein